MRRISSTRSKGCLVKKFYDLPLANLFSQGEQVRLKEGLKYGVLPIGDLCCIKTFFGMGTFSLFARSYYTEAGKTAKEVDYVCDQ